ncbi:hypothetical protein HAX54_010741 [Datura stramonium]|uniref:Uncharacterized protein n=1 Tax=Datura stramonium TaxID=4076 RepID=A0ABS8TIN6_DATST|nr:hypothetical protein [Datura stramonium]
MVVDGDGVTGGTVTGTHMVLIGCFTIEVNRLVVSQPVEQDVWIPTYGKLIGGFTIGGTALWNSNWRQIDRGFTTGGTVTGGNSNWWQINGRFYRGWNCDSVEPPIGGNLIGLDNGRGSWAFSL